MKILHLSWRAFYPVLLYSIILAVAAELGFLLMGDKAADYSLILTGIADILVLILAYACLQKERGSFFSDIRKPDIIDCLLLCSAGMGFCLVFNLLISLTGITSVAFEETQARLYAPPFLLQVGLMGLLIPAVEELIFRGFCFARLQRETGFWLAAILSSLLFGWFHGNMVQGTYAFFGGLLMAWGYEQFNSIKASFCLHASSNLLSLAISACAASHRLFVNPILWIASCLTGLLLLLVGVFRLRWRKGSRQRL